MLRLLMEAIVVGIVIVVIGSIVGFLITPIFKVDLPKICDRFNEHHVMEICLFLTGFTAHLFFEVVGANKWYCKNGVACKL